MAATRTFSIIKPDATEKVRSIAMITSLRECGNFG